MSYRDYLEAQKKYIETKKQARQLKEERLRNPRPPQLDPPPAPTSKIMVVGIILLTILPLITAVFILPLGSPEVQSLNGLSIWVIATSEEFQSIKNWLEPEILANDLNWNIEHLASRRVLQSYLNRGLIPDLLIADQELAEEMHFNQAAVSLWPKRQGTSLEDSFAPLWDPQPFRKTLGWIIPRQGHTEEARHLLTIFRQFVQPFTP